MISTNLVTNSLLSTFQKVGGVVTENISGFCL